MEFHACPAKYRLFGGAAGPGKSRALLEEACIQANETPGADTIVLRRTFPELEQTIIEQFRRHIPREMYRSYNDSKHIVTWWNGSTTRFGYCQSENDVYQYQGAEFLFIGFDELTHFTLKQWQYLTSRNRCPVAGSFPCMAGATNPGNIGHAWVKSRWIDKLPAEGMETPEQYDPSDYAFIRALISDNPIYAHDTNYLKSLGALPRWLRDALLHGDWDIFAGQYFDNWDETTMVVRPEECGIKPWWPRWVSIDWGFEHPAAVYWHTLSDQGVTITYRELVQNRLSPRMLAEAIVERSLYSDFEGVAGTDAGGKGPAREKISEVYLSPDAFAKRTDESTISQQIGEVLARGGLPHPTQADNDRVGGWMLMYQMLDSGHWKITENCPRLIKGMPTLVRDEKKVEDVQKMDGDDPQDSARYGLKSRHMPGQKPFNEVLREALSDIADPTSRAVHAQKMIATRQQQQQVTGRLRWMRQR